jgi:hypothetical protein
VCLGGIASRPSEESPSGPGREISHQWPSAPQRGVECLGTRRPLGTGESCLGVVEVPAKLFSFVAPLITNIFSVHEVHPYDVCYGSFYVHSNSLCLPFSSATCCSPHTRPWVRNLTPPNRNYGSFRSADGKTHSGDILRISAANLILRNLHLVHTIPFFALFLSFMTQ